MSIDFECGAIAGGAFVGLGTLLLALIWHRRASAGSFWGHLTKGQDDAN